MTDMTSLCTSLPAQFKIKKKFPAVLCRSHHGCCHAKIGPGGQDNSSQFGPTWNMFVCDKCGLFQGHVSFTPIVLSSTGGMGSIATTTYKRLASLLADKWGTSYSQTMGWLRCRLSISFSHLRSSIQCIRGARSNQLRTCYIPLPASQY